ncbi:hypothetical protein AAY473_016371 [Plecturocebus cupreus]
MGSHSVDQAGLDLLASKCPPISASQSSRITLQAGNEKHRIGSKIHSEIQIRCPNKKLMAK